MTYRVEDTNKIVEKDTGLTIEVCTTSREARKLCRTLNLGAGFNGWTPAFFTETFKQKERPSSN